MSGNFTTWRWLILIGCLAPIYWAAEGIARLFEAAVEWRYFEDRRVLYYLIGTTVRCNVFCTALQLTKTLVSTLSMSLAAVRSILVGRVVTRVYACHRHRWRA